MVAKYKRIHEFTIDGSVADDSYLYNNRDKAEKLVDMHMRDAGYVPHLDLDMQYFVSYNESRQLFEFSITAFGVFIGKKKAWEYVGFSGNAFIKK